MTGHYSMEVDGIEFVDLTKEQQVAVVHKLIDKITDTGILQGMVEDAMESIGDFTDLGKCETCGDWIELYKAEI